MPKLMTWTCFAFVACSSSKLDPNANVTVSGNAFDANGAPLTGTTAVLFKEPDVGEIIVGALEVTSSLGTVCLTANPPALCADVPSSTTDVNGRFQFSMKGKDTQGTLGEASLFDLSVAGSAGAGQLEGPASTETFQIQVATLSLPHLNLWNPNVQVTSSAGQVTVNYDSLPSSDGLVGSAGVTFIRSDLQTVWTEPGLSGVSFDARLLEDSAGGAIAINLTSSAVGGVGAVDFSFRSGEVRYGPLSSPPPSRGSACYAQGPSGPTALSPCSLTDADFETPYPPISDPSCTSSGCTPNANSWAYVDLGTLRPIDLVVVRGSVAPYIVELSNDAVSWTSLASSTGGTAWFDGGSSSARYVRVRATATTDRVTGLAEISVW